MPARLNETTRLGFKCVRKNGEPWPKDITLWQASPAAPVLGFIPSVPRMECGACPAPAGTLE